MKAIEINEQSLKEVLKREEKNAFRFDWTGWRIPIYLDKETGQISAGEWLNNNSHQPDAFELPVKIETWDVDFEDTEDMDQVIDVLIDESLDDEISEMMDRLKEGETDIEYVLV